MDQLSASRREFKQLWLDPELVEVSENDTELDSNLSHGGRRQPEPVWPGPDEIRILESVASAHVKRRDGIAEAAGRPPSQNVESVNAFVSGIE